MSLSKIQPCYENNQRIKKQDIGRYFGLHHTPWAFGQVNRAFGPASLFLLGLARTLMVGHYAHNPKLFKNSNQEIPSKIGKPKITTTNHKSASKSLCHKLEMLPLKWTTVICTTLHSPVTGGPPVPNPVSVWESLRLDSILASFSPIFGV